MVYHKVTNEISQNANIVLAYIAVSFFIFTSTLVLSNTYNVFY